VTARVTCYMCGTKIAKVIRREQEGESTLHCDAANIAKRKEPR